MGKIRNFYRRIARLEKDVELLEDIVRASTQRHHDHTIAGYAERIERAHESSERRASTPPRTEAET